MLMLRGTVPFVRPGTCWDLKKQCEKSVSVLRCKLGCSVVYNSVEGHHLQKPHIVHSFTRVSHHLCKSLKERTTRHWLVFIVLGFMISITTCFSSLSICCHASSDDDFCSSRNIANSLFKRYKNFIDLRSGDNQKVWILV